MTHLMNKLTFIGTGSAFNTALGNNSVYILEEERLLLVDCGGLVFHQLKERQLLTGLKEIHVLVTHTHPDHIGSLGELIFYAHFILGIRPEIYFPDFMWMKGLFHYLGIEDHMYVLREGLKHNGTRHAIGPYLAEAVEVSHCNTMPSFGWLISQGDQQIYYSGDANEIPSKVMELLLTGQLDRIYQDTCAKDYEDNPHLSISRLAELIPAKHRKKVYLMHFDEGLNQELIKNHGFQGVTAMESDKLTDS